MCSVMDLARAYGTDEVRLIEIEDCVKKILRYQAEVARMQFMAETVHVVKDTRRRKKKALEAIDERGEYLYRIVQKAVVRLNDLAKQKGMGMVVNLSEVISKESITAFCAKTAYELATGNWIRPLDPAPTKLRVIAA